MYLNAIAVAIDMLPLLNSATFHTNLDVVFNE